MSITQKPSTEQIETLRDLFLKKLEKEDPPCEGGFHLNDLNRVKTNDVWLGLFLEQHDLDMKQALNMLWSTVSWRKSYGTNDISEHNVRLDYLESGIIFPRNTDKDGKTLLIFKSKLHTKGSRDVDEMIRCLVYWIERLHRKENYRRLTVLFDMQGAGLSNMDMEFTKRIIDTLRSYYPNSLNYIIIFEMQWILNAAFKLIKSLLPPKAVQIMKFVNSKTMKEFITEENMLVSWGGKDNYEFIFKPEERNITSTPLISDQSQDSTASNHLHSSLKRVHFANSNTAETQMSEIGSNTQNDRGDGEMIQITPDDAIYFTQAGNELVGIVHILNTTINQITYKIKTTSPEKFRVRPSTGILVPGAQAIINVVLLQGQQIPSLIKDKFLIMCISIPTDADTSVDGLAEIWKNTPSSSPSVEQHRLKCALPLPSSGDKSGRPNGTIYAMEGDQQNHRVFSTLSQLTETTEQLETQIKSVKKIQYISMIFFLVLVIGLALFLKLEINRHATEMCLPDRG